LLAEAPRGAHELERAAAEGRRLLHRGRKAEHHPVHDAAEQVKRWGRSLEHSRGHAPTNAQQIAALAAAAAVERVERALGVGVHLAETAREQAPHMAQRLGDDVVPSLREIAAQAADAAVDRWHELREHAPALHAPELRHLEGNALHLATAGGELARETSAAVAGRAAELSRRAAEATEHTVDRARDASKRGAAVAGHAKDASVRTAEATVDTGKSSGAMLFWAGAAAGLIFYVLLSEERRQQITASVQALLKDIQGYDDEF
jgi:hypothetical protein